MSATPGGPPLGYTVVPRDRLWRLVRYARLRKDLCLSDKPAEELLDLADEAAAALEAITEDDIQEVLER